MTNPEPFPVPPLRTGATGLSPFMCFFVASRHYDAGNGIRMPSDSRAVSVQLVRPLRWFPISGFAPPRISNSVTTQARCAGRGHELEAGGLGSAVNERHHHEPFVHQWEPVLSTEGRLRRIVRFSFGGV